MRDFFKKPQKQMKAAINILDIELKRLKDSRRVCRNLLRRKIKQEDWMIEKLKKYILDDNKRITEIRNSIKILKKHDS